MSISVRDAVSSLQLFYFSGTYNLSSVFKFMHIDMPSNVSDLLDQIKALPDTISLDATILTDQALGGKASVTLHRNGSYNFTGFMHASGALSFSYTVSVLIKSPRTNLILSDQNSGDVFGFDTPGPRNDHWDKKEKNTTIKNLIRDLWPLMVGSQMVVNESAKLTGLLVKAGELIKNAAESFLVAETMGPQIAVLLFMGSELGDAGVDIPGFGGVIGVMVIEGAIFLYGPLGIGPAILLGVVAGAIIDALIGIRRLWPEEQDFAKEVFGDSLDFERIRLTNMVGFGGRAFTYPVFDDHILINIGESNAMYNSPITTIRQGADGKPDENMPAPGQLLIHELVHAWQIQHASAPSFVPGYLCDGVTSQVLLGQSAYKYGPAGADWNSFHIEAQAHIVDDWYGGSGNQKPAPPAKPGDLSARMNVLSPYFAYIENHIRHGIT